MRYFLVFFLNMGFLHAHFEKVQYTLSKEPIDVVVPCAPKDRETLEMCVQSIYDNAHHIRRVIVLSKERMTDMAEWYDERDYPFSLRDIIIEIFHGDEAAADAYISHPSSRATWIFQQFLKLYAPYVIPNISSNVLIVDSDLMFLNPIRFMSDEGIPFFNVGEEYHPPYFQHAQRLLPGLHRVHSNYSGICNYMLFQKPVLDDLFQLISNEHGVEAWKAFCLCIDHNDLVFSCLSEYEIYFNFVLSRTDQYRICPLHWIVTCDWHNQYAYRNNGVIYLTCHRWMKDLE